MPSLDALVFAPGAESVRLGGAPLALLPVLGRPLLGHAVAAARAAGATRVVLVAEPACADDPAFSAALGGLGVALHAAAPRAGNDGAGRVSLAWLHAALTATQAPTVVTLDGAAALVRPETLRQLLEIHARERAVATRLVDPEGGTSTPACVCVFERVAAARALVGLETAPDGDLLALFATLVESGGVVASAVAGDPEELHVITSAAGVAGALGVLRERRNRELLEAGVVIEDPHTTWIDAEVQVEPGARLRPSCHLEGRTHVAAGAEVGPFARLVDVQLGPGAKVLDHCLLLGSVVEEGAQIGPFAHVRPESRVRRRAKVGNFVELKKTDLGEDSKAPHLSYLGDATIETRVNVGAGTITCNYDGTHKHPTHVAEGAFIGSDTVLVAPVRVGAGAYVAAGSTITSDVPADALAFGRARQVVKAGGAKRLRRARGAAARH